MAATKKKTTSRKASAKTKKKTSKKTPTRKSSGKSSAKTARAKKSAAKPAKGRKAAGKKKASASKARASKRAAVKPSKSKKKKKTAGTSAAGGSRKKTSPRAGAARKPAAKESVKKPIKAAAPAKAVKPPTPAKTATIKTPAKTPAKTSTKPPVKAPASVPAPKTPRLTKSKAKKPRLTEAEKAAAQQPDANGYMVINGRRVRVIASKGEIKKKPKDASAATPDETPRVDPRTLKTPLLKKELEHFRELLLQKRRQLVGDLTSMEREALRSSDGSVSHMPIHMADVGSDVYEQDFMLGLAENDRQLLREIDDALQRIEDRTYGVCMLTGNPIGLPRLEAKPWAQYSIEAKRLLESGKAS